MKNALLTCLAVLTLLGCTKKPRVEFGLINGEKVVPTNEIRYQIGTSYGYRVSFPSDLGLVTLKQEFILPGAAPWVAGDAEESGQTRRLTEQRAPDGSRLVTETQIDTGIETGVIQEYRIIEGDPKGHHVIHLWLDGKPLKTMEFTIKE